MSTERFHRHHVSSSGIAASQLRTGASGASVLGQASGWLAAACGEVTASNVLNLKVASAADLQESVSEDFQA
jgi:hypothetical protein